MDGKQQEQGSRGRKKLYAAAAVLILAAALLLWLLVGSSAYKSYRWQKQYDLGLKYLVEQNYEQAIIAFTEAIGIEPKKAEAYEGRAEAYEEYAYTYSEGSEDWTQNLELAMADYVEVISLEEYRSDFYISAAGIYRVLGDVEGALSLIREAEEKAGSSAAIEAEIEDIKKEAEEAEKIKRYEAYYGKLTELAGQYGRSDVYVGEYDYYYLDGLFFAKLMDFGGDGGEALFLGYSYYDGSDPDHKDYHEDYYEIWEYHDGMLRKMAEPVPSQGGEDIRRWFNTGTIDGKECILVSPYGYIPELEQYYGYGWYTETSNAYLAKTDDEYTIQHYYGEFGNWESGRYIIAADGIIEEYDDYSEMDGAFDTLLPGAVKDSAYETYYISQYEYPDNGTDIAKTTDVLDSTFEYLEECLGLDKTGTQAAWERETKDWQEAYLEFLENADDEWKNESYNPIFGYKYYLLNVDGDDIPELYVYSNYNGGGSILCTYNGEGIETLSMWLGGMSYSEGNNLFMDRGGKETWYYTNIYTLEEGKPVLLHEASFSMDYEKYMESWDLAWEEMDWDYYWDGEQVSREEYDRLLEEASGGLDMISPGYSADSSETQYLYSQILNVIRFY